MNRTEQKISDGVKVYSIAHFSPTEELPVLRSECQAYPAVCPKVWAASQVPWKDASNS